MQLTNRVQPAASGMNNFPVQLSRALGVGLGIGTVTSSLSAIDLFLCAN